MNLGEIEWLQKKREIFKQKNISRRGKGEAGNCVSGKDANGASLGARTGFDNKKALTDPLQRTIGTRGLNGRRQGRDKVNVGSGSPKRHPTSWDWRRIPREKKIIQIKCEQKTTEEEGKT